MERLPLAVIGFTLFTRKSLKSFHAYTGLTPDAARIQPRLDNLKPD